MRREWLAAQDSGQYTPVFLPGEFHGQRSLEDCNPWGCKESDMTEQLTLSLFKHSKRWNRMIFMYSCWEDGDPSLIDHVDFCLFVAFACPTGLWILLTACRILCKGINLLFCVLCLADVDFVLGKFCLAKGCIYLFIYGHPESSLWHTGLNCCKPASSSCSKQGLLSL